MNEKKSLKLTSLSDFYISELLNLFHKKCSQKCSHSVDFYCNILKIKNSEIA